MSLDIHGTHKKRSEFARVRQVEYRLVGHASGGNNMHLRMTPKSFLKPVIISAQKPADRGIEHDDDGADSRQQWQQFFNGG